MAPQTSEDRQVRVGRDHHLASPVRPLRRDAELNLARIMEAARDVFAESGYDGSMEQIAAKADVGIGTLYRRFPHKEDLFNAVTDLAKERTIKIGEEVLAEVVPEDALFEFLRRCIAIPSCWRVTTARPPWSESSGVNSVLKAITPIVDEVLHRSQDAGAVRKDIVFSDAILALMSVRAVADLCGAEAPTASKRFLELVLDGLRPGPPTPVTPAMSRQQLSRVLTNQRQKVTNSPYGRKVN
jgi:AcrR family transcriptional regulator